jgi:hypothetical protein
MKRFDAERFAGIDAEEGVRRALSTYNSIYAWPAA